MRGTKWHLYFYNDNDAKMFGFDPNEFKQQDESLLSLQATASPKSFIFDDTILVKTNLIDAFTDDPTISNTLAVVNLNSYARNIITIKSPIYHPIKTQSDLKVWLTDSGGNDLEHGNTFSSKIILHVK